MSPAEKLLRELIALPSVNPALLPAGDPRAGEHRVADFLTAIAAKGGLTVERREVAPNRVNVLAQLTPAGKARRRIVLAPHMDTVGDVSMPDSMFQPRMKAGRLFGRGACDTKGSIAAMLNAVLNIAGGARPRETEIVFAALIDEEVDQSGSRALVRDGFRADLAIVGEPTRLEVVTAHKGDLWLTIETRGKAAHGARPELGRNAVHQMAKIVELLETKYARALRKKRHPLLGSATVNVGSIRGGTQPNIVPDQCSIAIDRRTIPGETTSGVIREIHSWLRERHLAAEVRDDKASAPCWPMETRATLPLVRAFMKVAGQRKPAGVHYFSDASVLARGGTPAVLFGPGDIAQAHTADEWISLRSLERGTNMLTRFLQSLP